jgi:hypothetical protein
MAHSWLLSPTVARQSTLLLTDKGRGQAKQCTTLKVDYSGAGTTRCAQTGHAASLAMCELF